MPPLPLAGTCRFSNSYEAHLARLKAAEPEATAERVHELEKQARRETRQSPAYTDITVCFSKSISIFHGSIRENARRAREAGDAVAAAWWDGQERRLSEILQEANRAALEHAQRWAGVTRTGYHGRKVNGQETGKWEDAEVVATSWLQGTSRDGEMQDHVHNPVLPKVRTVRDGVWRATDTMALRTQLPAMQAVASAHI
jgi:TrwC relaxase